MTAPITADLIMSTTPCHDWPRPRVERVLSMLDTSSWLRLAESARDAGWPVSLVDLRLTAYRAATPGQRMIGVRHSTGVRVRAQIARWPEVSPDVRAIRDRLLSWSDRGEGDIWHIRSAARAAAAADAAYSAAADAADAARAAAAAYSAAAADGLLYICRVLDGGDA